MAEQGEVANRLYSQRGAVLPMALLLLACTLLWGSVLLLTLSDGYAASNELVAREQSRLLAYSGWNMALQQLETNGQQTALVLEESAGSVQVSLQGLPQNLIEIQAEAVSQGYRATVTGTVRLLTLPWQEIDAWPIVMTLQESQAASLFITDEIVYELCQDCRYPLAICQKAGLPLTVQATEPITAEVLYIHGDLQVEAPLQAEAIYVSGQISGAEQISSGLVEEQSATVPSYRMQVVERKL